MTSGLLRMHRRFHTYVYRATRSRDDRRWGGWIWWGVVTVVLCVVAGWTTSKAGLLLGLGEAGLQRLALFTRIGALVGSSMWLLFEPGAQSPRVVAVTAGCVFTVMVVLMVLLV
ncbi:hypothetical protein ABT093_36820 [Kitasatospora sp. NPDC002551]|uniref:hypothetical protein n=1 Tax=Kitasatospora sp. NPDC002551 TaxID=3154539 RepID=UPI003324E7A3